MAPKRDTDAVRITDAREGQFDHEVQRAVHDVGIRRQARHSAEILRGEARPEPLRYDIGDAELLRSQMPVPGRGLFEGGLLRTTEVAVHEGRR